MSPLGQVFLTCTGCDVPSMIIMTEAGARKIGVSVKKLNSGRWVNDGMPGFPILPVPLVLLPTSESFPS